MPTYHYRCTNCGIHFYDDRPVDARYWVTCPECQADPEDIDRLFSFSYAHPMLEHYNPTLGTHVSNERQFRDGLKRQSDEDSARLNLNINYQPVDLNEREALGVTDEGLDSTRRRARDEGREESTKRIIT